MELNGAKFQAMRYGINQNIKNDTTYFTGDFKETNQQFSTVRDLGVLLSDDGSFKDHITHVEKRVRQKIGWTLRTFYTRRTEFMRTIYRSLILPLLDYCSQLYMPLDKGSIQKLENLQRDFFNKIPKLNGLSYWEQLNVMKISSVQRRMERYRLLYIWKTLEGYVPNCGISIKMD